MDYYCYRKINRDHLPPFSAQKSEDQVLPEGCGPDPPPPPPPPTWGLHPLVRRRTRNQVQHWWWPILCAGSVARCPHCIRPAGDARYMLECCRATLKGTAVPSSPAPGACRPALSCDISKTHGVTHSLSTQIGYFLRPSLFSLFGIFGPIKICHEFTM